ncbi:MAG: UDP-N-acetylmuramate dehydrogenase [Candidatus Omnitrophota bacterium]
MSSSALELRHNCVLKHLTTIKIGGQVPFFFIAHNMEGLQKVVKRLQGAYYLLGGGSNLLASDGPIKKAVIKLGGGFDYITSVDTTLEVGACTMLSKVIRYTIQHKLAGFDNLAAIPATVGGLIAMNASAFGRGVTHFLKEIEVMDVNGTVKKIPKEEITLGYRQSSLQESIVLRAWFVLPRTANIKASVGYYIRERMKTQDYQYPSCGCIFKNTASAAAGFLIDACGLKGLKKNDAQISMRHANFIINLKNASCDDVNYLIGHIKDAVYHKFGVMLEEEIQRWD